MRRARKTINVTLREKILFNAKDKKPTGKLSLYLDFYPPITIPDSGRQTRREVLGMYVLANPKTEFDKISKENTLLAAKAIRLDRETKIQNKDFTFLNENPKAETFTEFFKRFEETKEGRTKEMYQSTFNHLFSFSKKLDFDNIDVQFFDNFKKYLKEKKLAANTVHTYCMGAKAVLKAAFKEGYYDTDVTLRFKMPKRGQEAPRYLTNEELKKLKNSDCTLPEIKRAAMFSYATGLRVSDLLNLSFKDIVKVDDDYYIKFKSKKTGVNQFNALSDFAIEQIGEIGNPIDKIFKFNYSHYINGILRQWAAGCGITKDVTWHVFRHSFGTSLLTNGIALETISVLMGHADRQTTLRYAKVVDEKRNAASKSMNLDD